MRAYILVLPFSNTRRKQGQAKDMNLSGSAGNISLQLRVQCENAHQYGFMLTPSLVLLNALFCLTSYKAHPKQLNTVLWLVVVFAVGRMFVLLLKSSDCCHHQCSSAVPRTCQMRIVCQCTLFNWAHKVSLIFLWLHNHTLGKYIPYEACTYTW